MRNAAASRAISRSSSADRLTAAESEPVTPSWTLAAAAGSVMVAVMVPPVIFRIREGHGRSRGAPSEASAGRARQQEGRPLERTASYARQVRRPSLGGTPPPQNTRAAHAFEDSGRSPPPPEAFPARRGGDMGRTASRSGQRARVKG